MRKAAVTVFVLLTLAAKAAADPQELPSGHVRLNLGPGSLITYSGENYILPLGTHILTYEVWDSLDVEMRRLQEQETRLTAENKSLKHTAASWHPGWKTIAAGVLVGLSAGLYVGIKYSQ